MSKLGNESSVTLAGVRLVGDVVKADVPHFAPERVIPSTNGGKPFTIPAQWEGNIKVVAGDYIVSASLTWAEGGRDPSNVPVSPMLGDSVNIAVVAMSKIIGGSLFTVRCII
jgi:hypothetical protein